MRVILRILGMVFRKHKGRLLLAYISVCGAALTAIFIPLLLGTSVNRVLDSSERAVSQLYLIALALLLAGTARGLFALGQTYLAETTSQKVAYDIRNAYFDRLQHLSFAFHDRQMTGGLMSRATADVEGVRMFINMGAVRSGFVVAMVLGIAVAMFLTDVKLALVSLAFVPVLGWRAIVSSMKLRRIWLLVQQLTGDMVTVLQENLTGTRVVKAFAAEEYEKEKFRKEARRVAEETMRAELMWVLNFSFMNFAFIAAIGAILWVGGQDVIAGRTLVNNQVVYTGLTPGELTAFIFYMVLLTMPVRMLGWMVNSFSRAASCGERLFDILDAVSPVEERPDARVMGRVKGHVTFENVSLSYDGAEPSLKNLTLEVLPGQTVALVGRPGSGKTTAVHLIPRFYDVTAGRVTIDGVDIRDVALASLRDNVGIVQQDVFIHSTSIMDNIAYGQVDAPFEQSVEAARVAQLHDFVSALPDGYDTEVGERGVGLSGGQKQRLSIARTLLRNPPVLILDDSTSSVDAHTERLILAELEEVVKDRTTFIITNRLSSIKSADQILVFKQGSIVERGTHNELMALGGEYRGLYEFQLRLQEEATQREINDGGDGRML